MRKITDSNFHEVIQEDFTPIIILFSQDGCQTCEETKAIIESMAQKRPTVRYAEMDFSKSPETVNRLRISSAPTLIIYVDGMLRNIYCGSIQKNTLRWWLHENL